MFDKGYALAMQYDRSGFVHNIDTSQIQKAHGFNKAQPHNLEVLLYTVTAVVIDTVRVSPAILREVCHIIE